MSGPEDSALKPRPPQCSFYKSDGKGAWWRCDRNDDGHEDHRLPPNLGKHDKAEGDWVQR